MKRLLILILLALSLCSYAQEVKVPDFTLPRNIVKISPQHLLTNTLELGIERFNTCFSESLQFSAGLRAGARDYNNGKGAHLEFAYRNYLSPMKFRTNGEYGHYQGIYCSLFLRGAFFSGTSVGYGYSPENGGVVEDLELKVSSVAPGFTLGMQVTEWKAIVFDVFIGGGFRFVELHDNGAIQFSKHSNQSDPADDGIFIKTGLKIGVGF
jgi:hypothetical protein